MKCCEFETMRVWLAARLRARGVEVRDDDLDLTDALVDSGLASIAEVIRLDAAGVEAFARRLGREQSDAA